MDYSCLCIRVCVRERGRKAVTYTDQCIFKTSPSQMRSIIDLIIVAQAKEWYMLVHEWTVKVVTPHRDTIWALRCVQGWSVPVVHRFRDHGVFHIHRDSDVRCWEWCQSRVSRKSRGKIGCVLVLSNLAIHVSLVIQTNSELINTAARH